MNKANTKMKYSFLGLLFLFACQAPKNNTRVAVCASSYTSLSEVAKEYQKETGERIELIQGSSGRLTTQIIQKAPYDIFISADTLFGVKVKSKLGISNKVTVLTKSQLALWKQSKKTPQTIALANAKIAPFGKLAEKEVRKLNKNLEQIIGESVAQVNHYILTQSVDWAYTSYPSIKNHSQLKGSLEIVKTALPLSQGIICLNNEQKTKMFYDYLFSEKAQAIFHQNGFVQ